MKILLLCWRDTGHPQGGGSERYLERVGAYLAGLGHEVIYRTAAYPGAPREETYDGVAFQRTGGRYTVYVRAALAMLAGRAGCGRLAGIDAVVDTQNGIPFFARLFTGRPTVLLTHHCHRLQWPVAGPVIGKLGWWLESQVSPRLNRGAEYVTVSEPSRAELVRLGVDPQRIHIIRNGIDPVPVTGRSGSKPSAPETSHAGRSGSVGPGIGAPVSQSNSTTACRRQAPIHLVTLSRLVPHKRIEHALEATARIPGTVLDVIGSGWWSDKLQGYARDLGILDRVRFHGQVSDARKHELLAGAAVHLMPSKAEGWGLAVIEAAQHGVPTIGYAAAGGLNDSIANGQSGLLVAEDDIDQFVAAVQRLVGSESERSRLGAEAQRRAQAFSWQDTGSNFAELLSRVATRPSDGPIPRTSDVIHR